MMRYFKDQGDGYYVFDGDPRPDWTEITKAEFDANNPTPPAPKINSVTMRQARQALLRAGKLTQVESAIAAMTGIAGDEARIEWEYSNEVLRTQPLVQNLAAGLGMTEQEMDNLFTLASTL
jgi:hypothetical protein